jgi:tetratricopeptide (TPR) repeat protein
VRLDLELPAWVRLPSWRALAVAGASLATLAIVIAGVWVWMAAEQRRGLEAFARAMVRLQLSQAPTARPDAKADAVQDLEAILARKPAAAVSAQAAYEVGNVKYAARQYQPARAAYEITAAGVSPTLERLAQVNLGYTWEAQKDYGRAIETFTKALRPLKAGDFLYDELMMDLGRVQELAGRRDDAIKTYQRVADDPKSFRGDDARARLASLTRPAQ